MRSSKSRSLLLLFWAFAHNFLWCGQSAESLVLIENPEGFGPRTEATLAAPPATVFHSKKHALTTPITIGQSAALAGNVEKYQTEINNGITACIKKINKHGGIRGRKLQLKVLNNNNNPEQAAADIEQLRAEGVDIFLGNAGNRNIKSALPLVRERQIALFFPWGSALDIDPLSMPYLIHGQTFLRLHIRKCVAHLASQLHHTKIGIVHSDSAFGSLNAKYAEQLFKTYTSEPIEVTTCSYNSKTADVTSALDTFNKAQPHAMLFLSTSRPTAKIIKGIGEAGNYATDFVGTEGNFFAAQQFDNPNIPFYYTSSVPSLDHTEYPIVAEYLAATKKYLPKVKPSTLAFTYYINTKLLAHAIEIVVANNDNVTKETVIAALEKIRDLDVGGFVGEFSRKTHTLYPINVSIVKG